MDDTREPDGSISHETETGWGASDAGTEWADGVQARGPNSYRMDAPDNVTMWESVATSRDVVNADGTASLL